MNLWDIFVEIKFLEKINGPIKPRIFYAIP